MHRGGRRGRGGLPFEPGLRDLRGFRA